MSPKSLFVMFKKELKEEKIAKSIYNKLYKELLNDKKILDDKQANDYEYKYLRAVIAVENEFLTKEIKEVLIEKAFEDNLILEFVPNYEKTILVLKYVDVKRKVKKIG